MEAGTELYQEEGKTEEPGPRLNQLHGKQGLPQYFLEICKYAHTYRHRHEHWCKIDRKEQFSSSSHNLLLLFYF